MKFDQITTISLKKTLKDFKLNEEKISMVLGALVIVIVGILVVNYFKDRKGETLPALSSNQTGKEHIVVKGETLWAIAEDSFGSGYNWVDIMTANDLKTDKIEVGQKLTIPEVSAKEPTSTKQTITVQTDKSVSSDVYTVQKGDTLWKISVRAYGDGYQWTKIAKANNIQNPNLIYAGTVLNLSR